MALAQCRVDFQDLVTQIDHFGKGTLIQQFTFLIVNAKGNTLFVVQAAHNDKPATLQMQTVDLSKDAGQVGLGNVEAAGLANDAAIHTAVTEVNHVGVGNLRLPQEVNLLGVSHNLDDLGLRQGFHLLLHGFQLLLQQLVLLTQGISLARSRHRLYRGNFLDLCWFGCLCNNLLFCGLLGLLGSLGGLFGSSSFCHVCNSFRYSWYFMGIEGSKKLPSMNLSIISPPIRW